jgi:predicted unusual protein kinase regulating ubiquinone biosynthesis (AarF/ABC1/UbiB family)
LGQVLCARTNLLPPDFVAELERLSSRAPALSLSTFRGAVEEAIDRPFDEVFAGVRGEPVASSVFHQVQVAEIAGGSGGDGERLVALTVLRPGVEGEVERDLDLLRSMAWRADGDDARSVARGVLESLEQVLASELDLTRERSEAERMRSLLAEFPMLRAPEPLAQWTRRGLLVVPWLSARSIKEDPARRPADEAADLFRAYLKQILVEGAFHWRPEADQLVPDAKGRLVILGVRRTAFLSPATRLRLCLLLLAVAEGDGERAADVLLEQGLPYGSRPWREFRAAAGQVLARGRPIAPVGFDPGTLLGQLLAEAQRCQILLPPEICLVGHTLRHLGATCRQMNPRLDGGEILSSIAAAELSQGMGRELSRARLLSAAVDLTAWARAVPGAVREFLVRSSSSGVRLVVRLERQEEMLGSLERAARRLTLGILGASLLVAGALILALGGSALEHRLLALGAMVLGSALGAYAGRASLR